MTRYTNVSGAGKGRPCGLMAAWIESHSDWSALDHNSKTILMTFSHPLRNRHRESLKETAAGRELLSREKPKASATDPDEPKDVP